MTWLFLVRDHGDYAVLSEVPKYVHQVQFLCLLTESFFQCLDCKRLM